MLNMIRVDGSYFYLCRIVGMLKNNGTFKEHADYCGLFVYVKPEDNSEIPDCLKGVICDKDGKPLPIGIHDDIVDVVKEAFDADSGILVRIQSIQSINVSIIDAAISLSSALVSNKRYH